MRPRGVVLIAVCAAVAASAAGCETGLDAVRRDQRQRDAEASRGPGYLGDRAAVVAVVMEHLSPEEIDCKPRRQHVIRCHVQLDNAGAWDANETYVDVHISDNGRRLAATGPGVPHFAARYAGGEE